MRRNANKFVLFVVMLAVALAGSGQIIGASPAQSSQVMKANMSNGRRVTGRLVQAPGTDTGGTTGLSLRLSEGAQESTAAAPVPTAPAVPLTDQQLQAVLQRLPAPQAGPGDQTGFNRPAQSLPAPRPGTTITETFPPPAGPEPGSAPAGGPLEVVRHSPDGEVPLAPYLSTTFNQPMVALTGVEDLATAAVPVQLEPKVPGRWRWVGAQTLMFEPAGGAKSGAAATPQADRFPMATVYTATVPAGTTSASGGRLAQTLRWMFSTPPPQMETGYPIGGPQRLDPLIFVSFDQRIGPEAALKAIRVQAGRQSFTLRLATQDEIKADTAVARLVAQTPEGRWLAFRATTPFPPGTPVAITLAAGLPSAEGPLRTTKDQNFGFETYGSLRVVDSRCGWGGNCPPLQPWYIQFSNPLDAEAFDQSWARIDPAVPGAQIDVNGDGLSIRGATQGRTRYTVTLKAAIKDTFGQTLGSNQTVTFDVGSAEPALIGNGHNFVVLDPSAKPAFSVYSINVPRLKVQVQAVGPEDWSGYSRFLQDQYRQDTRPPLPGKQVINQTIQVNGRPDELVETSIDLASALPNGLGQLVILVEADPPLGRGRQGFVSAWVQATHIGLDAFVDGDRMIAWANALADGAPLKDVALSLLPAPTTAARLAGRITTTVTGAHGLAEMPLPADVPANLLVAQQGADLAILPQNEYDWGGGNSGWRQQPAQDEVRWYVFDDRGIYRPGEEVHFKGWLRRVGGGRDGDVGPLGKAVQRVSYVLMDPRGNKLSSGQANLNALSGFDFALTIPKETNLGQVTLRLTADPATGLDGREYNHALQVQEFRRPEFEVTAQAGEGPFLVGGAATASVQANYYAGGGLPNAEVTWRVSTTPGNFTPPNWSDFSFGIWHPWWISFDAYGPRGFDGGQEQVYTGHTDANGRHYLRLDFDAVNPPQPTQVTAEATVMDVNRQAWTAKTQMLVHPAGLYVGLRTPRLFVQREEPLPVDVIVVDLDGKPVAGVKVDVKAARLDWRYQKGQWQEVESVVQPCIVTSDREPVHCTFETPQGGTYRITATLADGQGRTNLSQITRWVSGGTRPPAREVTQEDVTLIPDRKEYQPGDTAEILVQAPFYPAEAVVTLRRSGIVSTERLTMTGPTYTLKVPIVDSYIPNLHVQVDLVGAAERLTDSGQPAQGLPKRPAYATGSLDLSVPPLSRTLAVVAKPRDKALGPGGQTTIDLTVKDAAGKPVAGAELAVVVVDEAVLALTDYQLADPLATFYSARGAGASDWHLRSQIVLANPAALVEGAPTAEAAATATLSKAAPGAPPMAAMAAAPAPAAAAMDGAAGAARGAPPIAMRTDFNALATFAPAVPTDADGRAQVDVKLPDNLTRYRVMAVAVADGKQFGQGESTITARLPLMVRPSAPRFLNFGDRFELPLVLQNQTDQTMTVTVAARATNAFLVRPNAVRGTADGYTVAVPANDRIEVRFPATTDRPGTARFQFGAVGPQAQRGSEAADAAEVSLPVYTPATTEAFATYGVLDQGSIAQPVIAPSNVYTQFGGLEVTTSSTALQALSDAVLYLTAYPFECSEQLASRILGISSLRDVLTAFQAEGLPSPEEMQAAVTRDITRLRSMQNPDGGWPTWRRGDESWPYHSIYVTHALLKAQSKDFEVPQDTLQQAQVYLQNIDSHIPSWYTAQARRSLEAYALYVRKLMGDVDTAQARALTNAGLKTVTKAGADISPEALGWLLNLMTGDSASRKEVDAIRQYLGNHVVETAGAANFVTSYGDDTYLLLASDRRADAVILDALIVDQPKSDLIPKLVTGLLAHRTQGRWTNTQENTFVLLALDSYFNTYEAQTPDFVARLWLGDQYAGQHAFKGYTTESSQIDVPMAYLAGSGGQPQDLILSKDGQGRLYYRLGLHYAPTDLNLKPLDAGFTVQRAYEPMDNPADVRQDQDGTWHIKAGARVRIRLTLVASSRRYHVALIDPLPAGFEALNPALAVTGGTPVDNGPEPLGAMTGIAPASAARPVWSWWRWWTWYEHQNLRDDRAEAFTSLLWDGVYNYTYTARATTPGTFVVPPAKAEEMYSPETFGRTGTERVVVE
jgi:alpha-2-macroglobulin